MSRTSDPKILALLGEAEAAGMDAAELTRWRSETDPVRLDVCGCRSGLLVSVLGLVVAVLIPGRRWTVARALTALVSAVGGGVLGKVLGARAGIDRLERNRTILTDRVDELRHRRVAQGT